MREHKFGTCLAARASAVSQNLIYRGLAVLSLVIIAVSFGSQVPVNREQKYGEAGAERTAPVEHPAKESFWLRTVDDPIALFTLVLSISTIGLWGVTWKGMSDQSRDMRKALRIAGKSAEAARSSAETTRIGLELSQRAYLKSDGQTLVSFSANAPIRMQCNITNSGSSPAIIIVQTSEIVFSKEVLPEINIEKKIAVHIPVSAQGSNYIESIGDELVSEEQYNDYMAGNAAIFYVLYIKYLDVFKNDHELISGVFIGAKTNKKFAFISDARYNYST